MSSLNNSRRILVGYCTAAALVILFAVIYNHFGHGVRSVFMDMAWVWPAGGAVLAGLFLLLKKPVTDPGRVCLACGLATLTVGSLLQGIFEIAGTNSAYITAFFTVGAGMLGVSLVLLIFAPGRAG